MTDQSTTSDLDIEQCPETSNERNEDSGPKETKAATAVPDKRSNSKKPLGFHLSFLALNLMVLMVSMDTTALAVAVPVIAHELHGTTLEAFWASLSFLVAVVVAQPIYTSISDVFGRTMPLHSTCVLFVVGSIVLATAHNMPVFIVGRIFQGFGAGGIDVLSDIILVDMTTLKERPLYLGLFSIPVAGGTIPGPIIGALFSEYAGWRWIGWINIPITAIAFLLALKYLRLRPVEQTLREKLHRLDWTGMALFIIGCTLFSSPLSWAGAMYPWSTYKTILPLILGFIVLVVFGIYEKRPVEPLFPYRIFRNTTSTLTLFASFFHGAVIYCGIFYLPLFFQSVYLETPLKSAVSILPLCCLTIGSSAIAGVTVEMYRKYKWGIVISWCFAAIGMGLLALWTRASSLAVKTIFQIILAIGAGPPYSLLFLPIQASMKNVDDSGLAVGMLISFRVFGGLVGLAMCSTIFNNIFEDRIADIGSLPESLAVIQDVREAIGFIPSLRTVDVDQEVFGRVVEAYRQSIIAVFLMLAGLAVLGFLSSLFIKELTLEKEELGKQRFEDNTRKSE